MKKILVTGASGQLGLTLQEMALDCSDLNFEFKTSQELDITKNEKVSAVFESKNFDFCINCAAYTNVEQAEKEPEKAFAVNAEGVKNVAIACRDSNIILIHISTDYVFDGEKKEPYLPDDEPNPINEYGRSKLAGEQHVQELMEQFYIIRTSWLYSKKYGKNFYRTILGKAKKGETLKVTDEQIGRPTDTASLSKFLIEELVLGNKPFGIYHFTDGKTMAWYGFAKKILLENGLVQKTKLVADRNYRTIAPRPKNSSLSP
ncbi:dTDP-4-dehydrorhamnose reductase [Allomuricauda sp. d1]|uniref:dTDP-4-dehydrorhamnose reductase n=1 Tax=Allomuricauda sp. d1 TaxID=3136725 RepID=UPI0031D508B2